MIIICGEIRLFVIEYSSEWTGKRENVYLERRVKTERVNSESLNISAFGRHSVDDEKRASNDHHANLYIM